MLSSTRRYEENEAASGVIPAQAGIQTNQIEMYCAAMEEIKFRTAQALAALKEEVKFVRSDLKVEFFCLQMQKIIELIALSSLVANKDKYAQAHKEFTGHWKAKEILQHLKGINPEFYPVPTKVSKADTEKKDADDTFSVWLTRGKKADKKGKTEPLTQEEFLTLYKECSRYLHVPNPFKKKPTKMFNYLPEVWLKKTILLLQQHTIKLVDDGGMWLITMNGMEEDVEWAIFTPDATRSPLSQG